MSPGRPYRSRSCSRRFSFSRRSARPAQNGVRGTLVDAFGVYPEPAVGAFMAGVVRPGASTSASWRAAVTMAPRPMP